MKRMISLLSVVSLRRLVRGDQRGMGHVELVVALLIAGVVGFAGYRVFTSSAASLPALNKSDCTLMGRVFNDSNGNCKKTCASGQGSYVTTSTYDYCSKAISTNVSKSKCADLGRVKLPNGANYVGCARRADQKTTVNAAQCQMGKTQRLTYRVASPYDKCDVGDVGDVGTLSGKCEIIGPAAVTRTGGPYSFSAKVTNTGSAAFNINYSVELGWTNKGGGGPGLNPMDAGTLAPRASTTIALNTFTTNKELPPGNTLSVGFYQNTTPKFECHKSYKY